MTCIINAGGCELDLPRLVNRLNVLMSVYDYIDDDNDVCVSYWVLCTMLIPFGCVFLSFSDLYLLYLTFVVFNSWLCDISILSHS